MPKQTSDSRDPTTGNYASKISIPVTFTSRLHHYTWVMLQDETSEKIFTRRQTLQMLAASAVYSAFALAGCGGGGVAGTQSAGGRGINLSSTNGKVFLPAGFSIPLAQLKGETAFDSQAVKADGTFATKIDKGRGATLGYLRHATTGKLVLVGYLGAGQGVISPVGAAVALLMLAINGSSLPPAQQKQIVSQLEGHGATKVLANTISKRIVINPYALFENDAEITASLKAAFNAVAGSAAPAWAHRQPQASVPAQLLVTGGTQSMARVDQGSANQTIVPVNMGRRPMTVYQYRTGFELATGGPQELTKAVPVNTPENIRATTSMLGSAITLGEAAAFADVPGRAMTLDLGDGHKKTMYETVILMASATSDTEPDPAFFNEAKYASEVAGWRNEAELLNLHACVGGILFELLGTVIGGATSFLSRTVVMGVVGELQAIEAGAMSQVVSFATKGFYTRATGTLMQMAVGSDIVSGKVRETLARTLLQAEAAGGAAISNQMLLAIQGLAALVVSTIAAAGTLVAAGDFLSTFADVVRSSKGERWKETVIKPTVAINPSTATLQAGGNMNISANAIGVTGEQLRYRWKLAGGNGVLGEPGAANAGREIETSAGVVNLLTAPSDTGVLTVTVEVFLIRGATRTSLGTATSRITMQQQAQIIPGTRQDFVETSPSGGPDPNYEVAILVRFTPVPGKNRYRIIGRGTPDGWFIKPTLEQVVETANWTSRAGTVLPGAAFISGAFGILAFERIEFFRTRGLDWVWEVEVLG